MICGIYQIRNIQNGCVYVGSSLDIDKRLMEHRRLLRHGKHGNVKLQRAWDKYGWHSFEFLTVEEVEDANFLLPREQFWIWRTCAWLYGYNICETPQNTAGMKFTAESKAKMSAAKKGKPSNRLGMTCSPEHIEKMRLARIGYRPTQEAIEKRKATIALCGSMNKSAETRKKLSEVHKSSPDLMAITLRMGERNRGRKASEATRLLISAAAKLRHTSDPEASRRRAAIARVALAEKRRKARST